MKKSYAVIGSGYGDEGKGAITDFLAFKLTEDGHCPVIARCNGGGQAGHTVQLPGPQKARHVFKHHGSGTLVGSSTYLSSDFIVNPIIFRREQDDLDKLGYSGPEVAVSPNAIVTLPMDMMINQAIEVSRGNNRHGSCGVGINETVLRSLVPSCALRVKHLKNLTPNILRTIRRDYGYRRLEELNLKPPTRFEDQEIDEHFLDDVGHFLDRTWTLDESDLDLLGDCVIFEGAQGLGLDQDKGHFPYVTRSSTGFKNMQRLAEQANVNDIEKVYVTRCYATRHGAGPLEWEGNDCLVKIDDPTNVHNPWQHTLRTAPLDLDLLAKRIIEDTDDTCFSLAITCLDQIDDYVHIVDEDKIVQVTEDELIHRIEHKMFVDRYFLGYGPTRNDYGKDS